MKKAKAPWDRPHPMARKCAYCKSQKPGMMPLTLYVKGKPVRGYWHLECFAKAREALGSNPDLPSEHDFKGNLEDWEDRVFLNADYFRLHRYYGRGQTDQLEVKTFPEALKLAKAEIEQHKRVLIYAVTDSGRFINCVMNRWEHYSQLWEIQHAATPSR